METTTKKPEPSWLDDTVNLIKMIMGGNTFRWIFFNNHAPVWVIFRLIEVDSGTPVNLLQAGAAYFANL